MKSITSNLATHLAGEVTTLATCWKLTRKDAVVMGFTDHDTDLTVDSVVYKAASGFTPSAIESNSSLAVDNLEIEGMLDSAAIKETDVMAGLYDFAGVEVFIVNFADISQGKLKLRRGWLGEVSTAGGRFVAEMRGLSQMLSQNIGELYSASCRAKLGDSRCKVNMAGFTVTGAITSLTSNQIFIDSSRSEASGYFNSGKITFTAGLCNGLSMEIKEYTKLASGGGKFTLALPMPFNLALSDSYSAQAGCDKTLSTCVSKYSNAVNFRGEPHVPGMDKMLETAGTRGG